MSATVTTQGGSKKNGPPKLRAACNQCNSAKVKCTGQKDGCNRCRNLAIECIYVESRVGKVPGTRAKKPRQQSGTVSADDSNASQSLSPQQPTPAYSQSPSNAHYTRDEPAEWDLEQHLNDSLMEFGNGGGIFTDQNELLNMQLSVPQSLDNETRVPDLDFNDEDSFSQMNCQNNPAGMSLPYEPMNAFSSTANGNMNPTNKADSHCILACTQMIDRLERYIFDELTTLDIVLDIVKKYLSSLEGLIDSQTTALSFSCKALFSVIMHQIVSLLEGGCRNFQKVKGSRDQQSSSGSWNTSLSSHPLPIFPMLGFGAFEIDAEEQHLWRSQVILKELRRSAEVLGKITALMRCDADSGCPRSLWNDELDERIRALCDVFKVEK